MTERDCHLDPAYRIIFPVRNMEGQHSDGMP